MRKDWLWWCVTIIAVSTVAAGATQLVAPGFVLSLVGGNPSAEVGYVFAIVGMFMVLFGGMVLHALRSGRDLPIVFLWASLQKFGAAAAVGYGVSQGYFGMLALGVAAFDFVSGVLMMVYQRRMAQGGND